MNFTGDSLTSPAADELEVSLFGPGFGECIVVHLGDGKWMIVDSCLDDDQEHPIALKYLRAIGVNAANDVSLVVVTHWHDDHIRGAARMFAESANARFACSGALKQEEFFALVAASRRMKTVARDSSLSEFDEILAELTKRRDRGSRSAAGPDHWAHDGMTLFNPTTTNQAAVVALSPSPQTVSDASLRLSGLVPELSSYLRRFPRFSPNDQSVALLVKSSNCSILLGADLETVTDPAKGWRAVVNSPVRPQCLSNAVKVAHHGSENGDCEDVWTALLETDPPAILTPYSCGKRPLPDQSDINRLKSRTSKLYCTCWPSTRRPPKRDAGVERSIREIAIFHRSVSRKVGHIRLRMCLSRKSTPAIETFDGACQL